MTVGSLTCATEVRDPDPRRSPCDIGFRPRRAGSVHDR
ncbi:hypothetical protein FHR80_003762 [Cellulomonas cellasea]|uniref:Uncharacterized protein n=1 Tax=Cellulomonas cellasea TaxID=43670 RepID=A0A7W4UIJ5_9CELL|nr:hypothetical protein [Cellulomonas cellasea]